ncbi:MAG: NAD(P)/FAD-dependent oxidoreductase [Actinomycetes bacterium]
MTTTDRIVIIGASLTGAMAAAGVREVDADIEVLLLGEEDEAPYERPELSKGFLLGQKQLDELRVHPDAWYSEHAVTVRTSTTVVGLDPGAHEVVLGDGERIGYRAALLATGARPRRLGVPGADLDGVAYLRTAADAQALRSAIASGTRVLVVGAGWIGLEVAAVARQLGALVTVVDPAPTPLHATLGAELGEVYAGLHREHGVDLRLRTGLGELTGSAGRVSGAVLTDGASVPADLVVVGIGALPADELARSAGVDIDHGVLTDEHLRTGAPDVYAAGDVARTYNPWVGERVRVEHWANARNQGRVAGRVMAGADESYAKVPYFYSDQYDLGMEYNGHVPPGALTRVVFRGDSDGREFLAFWIDPSDRVLAGMNANIWDAGDDIKTLVQARAMVDLVRLADSEVALADARRD